MTHLAVPADITELARRLQEAGHEAVVVGGAVRDSLTGRPAKDWDLATSALPDEVAAVFPKAVAQTRFGTTLVPHRGELIEITTFRTEGEYSDFRRPDRIDFTGNLETDLARRDLTINAMAYDPIGHVLTDPFGGRADLERKLLRAVGVPAERFGEDALRLLRVIRFMGSLGFCVEKQTAAAMRQKAHLARNLAVERVGTEYSRILRSPHRAVAMRTAGALGIIEATIPELDAPERAHHAVGTLAQLPDDADETSAYAALFHHCASDGRTAAAAAKHRLIKLAIGEDTARAVALVIGAERLVDATFHDAASLWRALRPFSRSVFEDGMAVRGACERSALAGELDSTKRFAARARDLYATGLPARVGELRITGEDLIAIGIRPGPELGALLRDALEATTDKLVPNEHDALLRFVRQKVA